MSSRGSHSALKLNFAEAKICFGAVSSAPLKFTEF